MSQCMFATNILDCKSVFAMHRHLWWLLKRMVQPCPQVLAAVDSINLIPRPTSNGQVPCTTVSN